MPPIAKATPRPAATARRILGSPMRWRALLTTPCRSRRIGPPKTKSDRLLCRSSTASGEKSYFRLVIAVRSASFDREGYDEVAGKRPLLALGSSAEWRGVVQGRVVANLRPDNEAFDLLRYGRLDGKSEGQRTVGRRSTTNRYAKWIAMFNPHKIQIAGKRGNEEAVIVAPDLSASSDLEPIVDRIGGVLGHTAARRVKPIITNIVSVGRQGELVGCLPDDGNVIEIT